MWPQIASHNQPLFESRHQFNQDEITNKLMQVTHFHYSLFIEIASQYTIIETRFDVSSFEKTKQFTAIIIPQAEG